LQECLTAQSDQATDELGRVESKLAVKSEILETSMKHPAKRGLIETQQVALLSMRVALKENLKVLKELVKVVETEREEPTASTVPYHSLLANTNAWASVFLASISIGIILGIVTKRSSLQEAENKVSVETNIISL
jgi:hypothetical protein